MNVATKTASSLSNKIAQVFPESISNDTLTQWQPSPLPHLSGKPFNPRIMARNRIILPLVEIVLFVNHHFGDQMLSGSNTECEANERRVWHFAPPAAAYATLVVDGIERNKFRSTNALSPVSSSLHHARLPSGSTGVD
jgi:hypothetical protein